MGHCIFLEYRPLFIIQVIFISCTSIMKCYIIIILPAADGFSLNNLRNHNNIHQTKLGVIRKPFFSLSLGPIAPKGPWPPHSLGFLDHTQRRTTVGRTPLDE